MIDFEQRMKREHARRDELRDYFAVHASEDDLRGQAEILRAKVLRDTGFGILPDGWRITARYMHADAMLAERAKEPRC